MSKRRNPKNNLAKWLMIGGLVYGGYRAYKSGWLRKLGIGGQSTAVWTPEEMGHIKDLFKRIGYTDVDSLSDEANFLRFIPAGLTDQFMTVERKISLIQRWNAAHPDRPLS